MLNMSSTARKTLALQLTRKVRMRLINLAAAGLINTLKRADDLRDIIQILSTEEGNG